MKNPGIYILTAPNGKQYIGKDNNLPNRSKRHLAGNGGSRALHNAINKHGAKNFEVEVIRYPGISGEALNAVEMWKIKQLGTKKPKGYNLTDGGEGCLNPSESTRRKMSEWQKGAKKSESTRRAMSKPKKSLRNRPVPESTRRAMSKAKRGKNNPFYGRKHSEESRRKMSENNAMNQPEIRAKVTGKNNPNFGKNHCEETRRKMSEKQKERWRKKKHNPNQLKLFD